MLSRSPTVVSALLGIRVGGVCTVFVSTACGLPLAASAPALLPACVATVAGLGSWLFPRPGRVAPSPSPLPLAGERGAGFRNRLWFLVLASTLTSTVGMSTVLGSVCPCLACVLAV